MVASMLTHSRFHTLALAMLAVGPGATASAQSTPSDFAISAQTGVVVQSYSTGEDQAVRQVSAPFRASVRHRTGFGASLRTYYVSSSGDGLDPLSGLADVQVGASYRRRVGGGAVEASLNASVPAGGATLTGGEFAMATAIAIDDYAFDVSTLGQGATVSPALSVVVPAGRALALGLGAAYNARGAYSPFADDTASYAPADEFVLSGGLDAQIGRASTFALDLSMVRYGDDEFGGRTFHPGSRLAATMRWAWGGGAVRGRLLARYRHIFDGEVALSAAPAVAGRTVVDPRPSHAVLVGAVQIWQQGTGVEFSAGARYYGVIKTVDEPLAILDVLGEQQVLIDFGLSPTIDVAPGVRATGTFVYTLGVANAAGVVEEVGVSPLSGFRAGAGLDIRL